MSFIVNKVYDRIAHEVLFSIKFEKQLRNPHLSLSDREVLGIDIETDSDIAQLHDLLGEVPSFSKVLSIADHSVEVVAYPNNNHNEWVTETFVENEMRKRIAYFLSERVFEEIGASYVQYKDAGEQMQLLWRRNGITSKTTLMECRGILYRLLKHNKNKDVKTAAKICLSKHYSPHTNRFKVALRKIKKQKLPEEQLLQMLSLRLVREKQI